MKKRSKIFVIGSVAIVGGCSLFTSLCSFAADKNNTATITVNINETLSMKINDSEEPVTSTVTMGNNELKEDTIHKINVATNNPKGYTLSVIDQDTDNSLKRDARSNIPATSGTTLAAETAGWGFKAKVPGATDYEADYHAVPISTSSAYAIYTNNGSAITTSDFNEDTYVKIGVATGNIPSGSYNDVIVYRAVGAI